MDRIRDDRTIKLPPFDPEISRPSDRFALLSVGLEPNDFGGTVDRFRYQFEGEEDLLHIIVTTVDDSPVTPAQGQMVCGFLLQGVSPALIWFRPGEYSQHFYVGHDELVGNLILPPEADRL
ncbi:hypothetical protein EON81_03380 [bacterium]|nr:MAG: hypothetical protein EON81_03380 [bacterium]